MHLGFQWPVHGEFASTPLNYYDSVPFSRNWFYSPGLKASLGFTYLLYLPQIENVSFSRQVLVGTFHFMDSLSWLLRLADWLQHHKLQALWSDSFWSYRLLSGCSRQMALSQRLLFLTERQASLDFGYLPWKFSCDCNLSWRFTALFGVFARRQMDSISSHSDSGARSPPDLCSRMTRSSWTGLALDF